MFGKRKKTLMDVLSVNLRRPNRAPDVRIPRANTPRAMPSRTGMFTPIRQSKN